jgi:hypothetical protein
MVRDDVVRSEWKWGCSPPPIFQPRARVSNTLVTTHFIAFIGLLGGFVVEYSCQVARERGLA